MKPIAAILVAVATTPAFAYTPIPAELQWRVDTSSGHDRYIWPEVSDEFIQNATLEEITTCFLWQSFYGGAQLEAAWWNRRIAGNRIGPMPAPMHGVLTEQRLQILVDRMIEQARLDPLAVSGMIRLLRWIGPTPGDIPFRDEKLTLAFYEGIIDLPGVPAYELSDTPLMQLIHETPRTDRWLARIQADIEAERLVNGESKRLSYLRFLKAELGGRPCSFFSHL